MIQSPLNYTGGKYKLLPQILPLFPKKITTFVDLFCGGCNVGINVDADNHLYNDNCKDLIELYRLMKRYESAYFVEYVERIIHKYDLSDIKTNGYDFYGCSSTEGLSNYNKEGYLKLRSDVNSMKIHNDEYYISLYVLIVYAFNNQIRFNKKGEFNLPPGKRDFNLRMQVKLTNFMNRLHRQNSTFSCFDFRKINLNNLGNKDLVYADPPYLITCASYNEQGGWTEKHEYDLLELLDDLNERNVRFALSNVIESKGKRNIILQEWIYKHNYRVVNLDYTYKNSNYQRKNKESETKEILVVNY